jgi:hypothetical protein
MFRISGKKKEELKMADLNGEPLSAGDMVESLRYDLGVCLIVEDEIGLVYESLENNKQVSWVKMVDATSKFQKVRKIK